MQGTVLVGGAEDEVREAVALAVEVPLRAVPTRRVAVGLEELWVVVEELPEAVGGDVVLPAAMELDRSVMEP